MTGGTDGIQRYPRSHVAEALAQIQSGGRIEPHSAIVVALEVRALEKQLAELRTAAAGLVQYIEHNYYNLVAPSDVSRRLHGGLGALTRVVFNVLERLKP